MNRLSEFFSLRAGKFNLRMYLTLLLCYVVLSIALHWRVFNYDLIGIHVWRQAQTQTVIDNFKENQFNILSPRINNLRYPDGVLRLEFPLMQWLFAVLGIPFGGGWQVSRVFSFIVGMITLAGFYKLAFELFRNNLTAAVAAWCFGFSPLFFYYSLNPLPDNFSLMNAVWGLWFLARFYHTSSLHYAKASIVFIAIAACCKLPYIMFLFPVMVGVWSLANAHKIKRVEVMGLILFCVVAFIPFVAWYGSVIPSWGKDGVVKGIFSAGTHTNYVEVLKGLMVSLLPELIINYASLGFFLAGIFFFVKNKVWEKEISIPYLSLGCILVAYVVYEIDVIQLVHDYYLMPFLPLIFLMVGYGFSCLFAYNKTVIHLYCALALLLMPLTAYMRCQSRWNPNEPGFPVELYRYKNEIRKAIPEGERCVLDADPSGVISLYYASRKGWVMNEQPNQLDTYIHLGARYWIGTQVAPTSASIHAFMGDTLFQREHVVVCTLKKNSNH